MTLPLYVANTLIFRAIRQQVDITHLKLQKLIYILYARYLARTNDSLFPDRFEAWKYGPALSMIYHIFKSYAAEQITEPVPGTDGKIWLLNEVGAFKNTISEVWNKYGFYSAADLVAKTHENGSAWRIAFQSFGIGGFLVDEHIKQDGERWFVNAN